MTQLHRFFISLQRGLSPVPVTKRAIELPAPFPPRLLAAVAGLTLSLYLRAWQTFY